MLYQGVVRRGKFAVLVVLLGILTLKPFFSHAANVSLAWDASTDADVTAYRIYYGVASGGYTNAVQVGNTTTVTISNLAAGATYYFTATAVNSTGDESDFSNETSFNVPAPANQPPTLNAIANLTINEGSTAQIVSLSGISSGSIDESQTLVVTASSSSTGLIPNPAVSYTSPNSAGTLTFTPSTYAFGTATITVTVNDGASNSNIVTRTFTVTVLPVNQSPTLNTLANLTINEGAAQQTVNLSGIGSGATNESQTLTVTASSSNTGLIPNPTVTYTSPNSTGSLMFTPVSFANGSATVTVTVNDGGSSNNIITRSFTITVNSVNQSPTLNALANVSINEGAGLQTVNLSGIGTGATNEAQTLTVTASSSNTGLIPNPTVNYTSPSGTGSISFTPTAGSGGTATISVNVNDGGANNNTITRTFTVSVNRLPVIGSISNRVIAAGTTTGAMGFTISDTETAASSLTLSASSSNTTLVQNTGITFGGSGGNRTVTVTPVAGQTGTANISITVSDGSATVARTFQLDVLPKPAAPTNLRIVQATP